MMFCCPKPFYFHLLNFPGIALHCDLDFEHTTYLLTHHRGSKSCNHHLDILAFLNRMADIDTRQLPFNNFSADGLVLVVGPVSALRTNRESRLSTNNLNSLEQEHRQDDKAMGRPQTYHHPGVQGQQQASS